MKRIIPLILAVSLLCGCSIRADINNTKSNNAKTEKAETLTEIPSAKAVAGIESLSAKKVVWGPGNITGHKQPDEPVKLNSDYFHLGAKWLLDDGKCICLTFDEGYENGYTPAILDVLKDKKVKAVFFVTYDFAKDNPALIQRMLDEGHIVGNHSYHHYSMDELDTDAATEEIEFLHNYIREKYNYTMSYFRFPKGEFSEKSLAIAQKLGYESVFWSFAYADWEPDNQPEPEAALKKICESTHPGEIMLLHAVSKTNAVILGEIIDEIRRQGYEFTLKL